MSAAAWTRQPLDGAVVEMPGQPTTADPSRNQIEVWPEVVLYQRMSLLPSLVKSAVSLMTQSPVTGPMAAPLIVSGTAALPLSATLTTPFDDRKRRSLRRCASPSKFPTP